MSSDTQENLKTCSIENMTSPQSHSSASSPSSQSTSWMKTPINSDDDWECFYKKVRDESFYFNLYLSDHYDVWWKLISAVPDKPNKQEITLECFKQMVESIPVGTTCRYSDWFPYVETAYIFKSQGSLSDEGFDTAIKWLEHKLSLTYTKAGLYWETIRKSDQTYFDPEHDAFIQKCLETYKKQFSTPYINMKTDFKKFKKFAFDSNLDSSLVEEVSSVYFDHEEEAKKVTNEYMEYFEANNHHVVFEKWILNLLERSPPQLRKAIALCEETVCDERNSVCYHFLLAKTLVKEVSCEIPERNEKLFNALKRGIQLAKHGCDDMFYYYLDFALNVAATRLTSDQAQELFSDIINKISFDDSLENYFASRKALILGIKALIDSKKIPLTELQHKLVDALKPITMDGFNGDGVMNQSDSVPDFELRCVALKKLALLVRRNLLKMSWEETRTLWERGFSDSKDPFVLVEYINFIRENGPTKDVEAVYMKAIKLLEALNNSPSSTFSSRRCLFSLQNKLREFVAINGGQIDTVDFLSRLSIKQSESTLEHNERYFLSQNNQVYTDSYIAYYASSGVEPLVNGAQSNNVQVEENAVTDKMEKLSVEPSTASSQGFPVFLSNLKYTATKADIIEAFKENGLDVVRVKMGMDMKKGHNYGFACVELKTEQQAKRVILEHDHMKILGRETFVSVYKEKTTDSKKVPSKMEPTLLFISGLPDEWKEHSKLESFLAAFGHIKGVDNQDETGSIVKVEYHMSGDSMIGLIKLQEKFGDTIQIRRGFVGGKVYLPQKDKPGLGRFKNKTEKPKSSNKFGLGYLKSKTENPTDSKGKNTPSLSNTFIKPKPPQAQAVKRQFTSNAFVPLQLRHQMKKKLDVNKPDEGGSKEQVMDITSSPDNSRDNKTSQESEDLNPPAEKKVKENLSSVEGEKLTNNDFRKMFNL